ncbi:hypothetical protein ACLOJK_007399 [Asimina triloba]
MVIASLVTSTMTKHLRRAKRCSFEIRKRRSISKEPIPNAKSSSSRRIQLPYFPFVRTALIAAATEFSDSNESAEAGMIEEDSEKGWDDDDDRKEMEKNTLLPLSGIGVRRLISRRHQSPAVHFSRFL